MKKPVRILIVEDVSEDVDLAKNEICKVVGECEFQVVETYEGFLRAIETFEPDVIISDYTLPRFDGLKALALTQKHAPLTPFIIWSGSISENLAVECVRAGANNYIFKDNLKRLGPAVARALEEKELMAERRQAEEALQNNEKRFRALIENGLDDISLLAADGRLLWESPSTVRNLGYQPNEFVGRNIFDLMHPDDLKWTRNTYVGLLQSPGARQRGTFRLRRSDGTWRWVEAIATNMLDDASVKAIVVNYRDITEQKQTEIELQQKNADLALINALNELINRGEALDAVMNRLREETKRIFSTDYTNIYLLNKDGQSLKTDQYSLPPHVREKIERLVGRAIPVID
ncbi:MAG: PAS domain S-box protein, partial [Anaerolineales bacterium]